MKNAFIILTNTLGDGSKNGIVWGKVRNSYCHWDKEYRVVTIVSDRGQQISVLKVFLGIHRGNDEESFRVRFSPTGYNKPSEKKKHNNYNKSLFD